jgi:hypothetical protein
MKKKIGIVYSSFNNYNLLENEVLKRVEFENYPVINIDDYSSKKNFIYGKKLCNRKKIYFKKNTQKGLQFAVNEGINFLYKKYDCEWIFCLQQDIYPIDKYFFSKFEKSIKTLKNKSIGAIGFNIISDDGIYMNKDIMDTYKKGIKPKGWLGCFTLSFEHHFFNMVTKNKLKYIYYKIFNNQNNKRKIKDLISSSKNFCEYSTLNFKEVSKLYNGLSAIDLPMWGGIAINVKLWRKYIKPRKGYIFHLWFPDIAYQFLKNNIWMAIHTSFYLLNKQKIKEKYGYIWNSALAGKEGKNAQVEKYGDHLNVFKSYWGFDFEDPIAKKKYIIQKYKGTLIEKFVKHDYRKGPMKKFK